MSLVEETFQQLSGVPHTTVLRNAALAAYTRFAIGGPADVYVETGSPESFIAALNIARASGLDSVVIGGGTNLIVSDDGFRGVVLRLANHRLESDGTDVHAESGAVLQDLVDFTVHRGLKGLETLTGIPGSVGAAIYGNAGAYGHSVAERIVNVNFYDGDSIRTFDNAQCQFRYRESVFKRHKEWIVFSAGLAMEQGDREALEEASGRILKIRNAKYPPSMKCAGSIFKNFLLAELPGNVASTIPENVVIEGKVPSAWFLEQVGAKGMKEGDIHVADYHANLIYNAGSGTAHDLKIVIGELKKRVGDKWGIPLEEEVQYIG